MHASQNCPRAAAPSAREIRRPQRAAHPHGLFLDAGDAIRIQRAERFVHGADVARAVHESLRALDADRVAGVQE